MNFDGDLVDFATLYQNHIYADLMDQHPMIYVDPAIPVTKVKEALLNQI